LVYILHLINILSLVLTILLIWILLFFLLLVKWRHLDLLLVIIL